MRGNRYLVQFSLALTLAACAMLIGCGLRTNPRPPEDTAPVIEGIVEASRDGGAVVVRWKRADKSADGMRLDDLASFLVERKRESDADWQSVATIDVVDQEKIRRRHHFSWRDEEAGGAAAAYRVRAVTTDGQQGPPIEGSIGPVSSAEDYTSGIEADPPAR